MDLAHTDNGNAVIHFVERPVAEGNAEKVVFREVDGDKRILTYGQLSEASSRFAGALKAHGVRREERVAMIMLDRLAFPIVFWGAIKFGAIPVPMNTLLASEIYRNMLDDSRASVLVVSAELLDVVKPAIDVNEHLRTVIVEGASPAGMTGFAAFVHDAPAFETVHSSADETAFWLYSSGSTGSPKGVRHVHASLQSTCATYGDQVLGIRKDDVVFSAAKLFFAYGLGNGLSFPQSVCATTLLLSGRPAPQSVLAVIERDRPTVFFGVPTLYAAMINQLENTRASGLDHNLRICVSAGEALPREIGERWEKLTGTELIDGVGSTEMLHIFLSNSPDDVVYGTSGTPVPGYRVRLVDENDHPVGPGEIGELLVSGPSSSEGYWNRREKSQSTFEGHWTRTGDKYEKTNDGRYLYCGRSDDMFKVSGIWLSPFEVEQALIAHPAVLEAAVVAHKDQDGLEKPSAFLVLKDAANPPDETELKKFVQEKVGLWKYPRWFSVVDALPKTATGKIQRFKLRDQPAGMNVN